MKCPKCGLENVPTARYCDCGYDFQTSRVDESKRLESPTGRNPLVFRRRLQ